MKHLWEGDSVGLIEELTNGNGGDYTTQGLYA